jgi:hypothetical protein
MKKLMVFTALLAVLLGCQQATGNGPEGDPIPEELVGEWGNGGGAFLKINADGTGWLNTSGEAGTWAVSGSTLTFTKGSEAGTATYYLAGGTLSISGASGALAGLFETAISGSPLIIVNGGKDNEYLVLFMANYEDASPSIISSHNIAKGNAVRRPENPSRAGYIFLDWFSEPNGYVPYDFAATVSANTILYARWDNPTVLAGPVGPQDVDQMFDVIHNLVGVEQRYLGANTATFYHSYYRSSDGSVVGVIASYNQSNALSGRSITWVKILPPSSPVLITAGEKEYTFTKRVEYGINVYNNFYEISGAGRIVLKSTTTGYPAFDKKLFAVGDFPDEDWYYVTQEVYDSLAVQIDSQNLRQVEITTYSPDALTLSGFLGGVYYYVGKNEIFIPMVE